MTSSKYEKYVVRKATPPININAFKTNTDLILPYFFLTAHGSLKEETDTMLEYFWIEKDFIFGATPEKPPHKHDCAEIFLFMGIDPKDPDDLGGEIEFWMGEEEETEQIKINTSSLIYVPGRVLHMPIICRNIKRPILNVVIALNIGDTLKDTINGPVRGV